MRVEVLGNVQDGGVPHLGCECEVCEDARENPEERKYISSLLLKENEKEDSARYLIDASPDARMQVGTQYIDGVFIPLATLGHLTGLQYFGPEGPDAKELSVYCCEDVKDFMMKNDPYRLLIDRDNLEVHNFSDGEEIEVQGGSVESIQFYHKHVNYDTTGYMIKGENKKLFFLDDITEFTPEIVEAIEEADIAVIDGTFWSEDEIDRYEEVPHPPIRRSLDQFEDLDTKIYFTHLNHTNPVLREDSEQRDEVEDRGFHVAEEGFEFKL
jgi:pyrroloquinoline quinone biosynthesis protein B